MPCPTKSKLRAEVFLGRAGLRITKQRLAIAIALFGERHHHVTAESLFSKVKGGGQKVSLATVYNTLEQFSKAGLVREIAIDGTRSYFDTNTANHSHFYDGSSGSLIDIEGPVSVSGLPDPPDGTSIRYVDIVVRLERPLDFGR
jgi:Fur family iron response transcriptional regulator